METAKRKLHPRLLLICWLTAFLAGAGFEAVFVVGKIRDTRPGEPVVTIDLSSTGAPQQVAFRPNRDVSSELHLSSVNHQPPFGHRWSGVLQVTLVDPHSGNSWHTVEAAGSQLQHERPDNTSWTSLGKVDFRERPVPEKLLLRAVVTQADPAFAGVRSQVRLRASGADRGMAGMFSYLAIFPAGAFLALATLLAARLSSRHRMHWPLAATLGPGIGLLLLLRG